jgi:type VI secretion system protein VasG
VNLSLKPLIGKLNDLCRKSLEGAAGLCLTRTHYEVDLEHFLVKLIEAHRTDLHKILRHWEIDASHVSRDLTRALDRLKTGNSRNPVLSRRIPDLISEAWSLASIEYGTSTIRSSHILLALLSSDELSPLGREIAPELKKIQPEELKRHLRDITAGSQEDAGEPGGMEEPSGQEERGIPRAGKTPALDQYTVDLTARAREGRIDPVLGRDFEIRQVIDILTRRRQNNPILTGEAGVGKTAVVEGFALRIAQGDVPDSLKNVAVRTLDLGLLQAGAGVKGEFENRLKSVIDDVKSSPQPIIVFIDEAHTLIGAGGQAGQNDAANLLKPALARGELRTIAATTWAEYKKYFEKDAALARRFQGVKVEEPREDTATAMLRGIAGALENHHKVRILDEAVCDAVKLSMRYITGRQLPDKGVGVLDTACAKVAIGQAATPPAVEDAQRRIENITIEIGVLERESATGADHRERLLELRKEQESVRQRLERLKKQWDEEARIIGRIRDVRGQLEELALGSTDKTHTSEAGADPASLKQELERLNAELKTLQGETPLMQACVNSQTVAEVISGWTGVPVGKMLSDEIQTVLALEERLKQRIMGQDHALTAISRRIRTSRASLTDPRKPIGVFLFVGPSGVGKTETALALAETLYGGERNLITINMSEYQEAHTVSSLKGSPPGYVGYGEGGVLTEAVRRRPYSVVLLDEVEKAHPDVMELFFQVFDKGVLEDGEGREIDFKNTIILLTTNIATETIMKLCADPDTRPVPDALTEAVRPELMKVFKPALLGRMAV